MRSIDILDRLIAFPTVSRDSNLELIAYEVVESEFPANPNECDAYLITGSKFGVYDDEPWIEPLKAFLCACRDGGIPMVGVCFGHQIMAEAFGGRAEKSSKGWGCGVHTYEIERSMPWFDGLGDGFAMHAMHQDQVTELAPDAIRVASSEFCENAMIAYGDAEAPYAISIQPHPEFTRPFAEALVNYRRSDLIPEPVADVALASFGNRVDGEKFAACSLEYIRTVQQRNDQTN